MIPWPANMEHSRVNAGVVSGKRWSSHMTIVTSHQEEPLRVGEEVVIRLAMYEKF